MNTNEHKSENTDMSDAEIDSAVNDAVRAGLGLSLGPCCNCAAVSPKAGRASDGRVYCCVHCCFNPLGCRCEHGEFGVAETQPGFALEPEDDDDDYVFD